MAIAAAIDVRELSDDAAQICGHARELGGGVFRVAGTGRGVARGFCDTTDVAADLWRSAHTFAA